MSHGLSIDMITRFFAFAALVCAAGCVAPSPQARRVSSESELREALASGAADVEIAGVFAVTAPVEIASSASPLQIRGSGTLRVHEGFQGSAVLVARGRSNLSLLDFTIEGPERTSYPPAGLPPSDVTFAAFYRNNGIVLDGGENIRVENVHFRRLANFALIASSVRRIRITGVVAEDGGSLNAAGRNNTSGGILLEEGTSDFEIRNCTLRRIRGNAIWTHSRAEPRSANGTVAGNTFSDIGRDAVQIGHATRVRVEGNFGERIGYPAGIVDAENHGTPVALDTAGNVDGSIYRDNRFRDVNGECINLDGFHDGEVIRNVCESTGPFENYPYAHEGIVVGNGDPGMESRNIVIADNRITGAAYGALFLIGTGHTVTGNRFLMLNRAGCRGDATVPRCNYALDQPDMLRSGIYLATGANRKSETRNNRIRNNELRGFGIARWCVAAAPGLSLKDNDVGDNICTEDSAKR